VGAWHNQNEIYIYKKYVYEIESFENAWQHIF